MLVIALLPPVQLAFISHLTREIDGVTLEAEGFSATPWAVRVDGLRLSTDELMITIEHGSGDLAFWSSLMRLKVDFAALRLEGATVALSSGPAADRVAAASDGAPTVTQRLIPERDFAGFAEAANWPAWLVVRDLAADLEIGIETAAANSVNGSLEIVASNWSAGAEAGLSLFGQVSTMRAAEALAIADLQATATAMIGNDAAIEALDLLAILTSLEGARGLELAASAAFGARETYAATLTGIRGVRLADLTASLDRSGELAVDWSLELPPGIVASFGQGETAADLAGTAAGELVFDQQAQEISIRASADVVGSGFSAYDPRLRDLGAVTLGLDIDADFAPAGITARTARLGIGSAARGDMLRIEALQPLDFDSETWLINPETWGEPALIAELDAMPIRWLRHFDPSGSLVDGQLSFALQFIRDEERVTRLVALEPLRASSIRLEPVGDVEIPEFAVSLTPRATLSSGALEADIESLSLEADTGLRVDFSGVARTSRDSWPVADFAGDVAAVVPALQRIVPTLDRVQGTYSLHFDFSSLVLRVAGATLGARNIDGRQILTADLSGQEPLQITLPLFVADWDAFEPQSGTLNLDRMPIDWLSPYIPELALLGGELSGTLETTAGAGIGLELTAAEPLSIEDVTLRYRGRESRQSLAVTARPSLRLSNASSLLVVEDLGLLSPDGDSVRGRVAVEADADDDRIDFDVSLRGELAALAQRYGARIGPLRFENHGRLDPATGRVFIESLMLDLADQDGNLFLELANVEPFFVDQNPFAVGTSANSDQILRAAVTPMRLEQLLPAIKGLDIAGVSPGGEISGRAEPGGRLVIATENPFEFRDVTVSWGEAELLDRVTLDASYALAYSADAIEVRSVDLSARDFGGETMLSFASTVAAPLTAERTWALAEMNLQANLVALAGQPVLAGFPTFTSGRIAAELAATNEASSSLTLIAAITQAVTEQRGAMPDVELTVSAAGVRGEGLDFSIPIVLESEEFGRSGLLFDGTLDPSEDGPDHIEASLTGTHLSVADLRKLAELISSRDGTVATLRDAAARQRDGTDGETVVSVLDRLRTERHRIPIWGQAIEGSVGVDIERVSFRSFALDDLTGSVSLSPSSVQLSELEASLLDAELSAQAAIGFNAEESEPYSLRFDSRATNVDLGRLFLSAHPETTPTAEGLFDLTTSLAGSGRNPIDLVLSALGEIRLTGRDGIFRGLADFDGSGSTAARVIGALTFSRELRAVGRLLDGLGEIRFTEAELILDRLAREELVLRSLSLRAPQIAVEARGRLELAPRRPLLLSPLALQADIAARRDVAIVFDGMELLEEPTDDGTDEYRSLIRSVEIGGTPAEPDTSAFWAMLEEGSENARGSFGLGLRALNERLESRRENAGP